MTVKPHVSAQSASKDPNEREIDKKSNDQPDGNVKPVHYPGLDGLRGLAALMVVFGHAGYHGWVPLVAGCATIGVVLFFFLSGFLMGHHYMPDRSASELHGGSVRYWAFFLMRRFVRVYPPYMFAPLVGYLLLMPLMPPDFETKSNIGDPDTLRRLLTLMYFDGNPGIYWTIKVELFFYLIYPVVMVIFAVLSGKPLVLFLMTVLLMALNHFPHGVEPLSWSFTPPALWPAYCSMFLAGVFTAVIVKVGIRHQWLRSIPWNFLALASFFAFGFAVFAVSASGPTQTSIWHLEWMFGGLFMVLFVSLVRSDGVINKFLSMKFCVSIGRVSYTIYLIHIISFYIVHSKFSAHQNIYSAMLILAIFTPIYYLVFERPFVQLSKAIRVDRRRCELVARVGE